jgi:hypothetical protein
MLKWLSLMKKDMRERMSAKRETASCFHRETKTSPSCFLVKTLESLQRRTQNIAFWHKGV